MCGIAGYIGKDKIDKKTISKALRSMAHRGPDSEGYFESNNEDHNIYLLHSRLSIIDLRNVSNQPFHYEKLVLIYNGEIYNYLEIRLELEKLGYKFNTNGDTEVLIKSFDCWGEKAFNKFEGMWSFAIYDKSNGKFILSRDRFGEKPLFYYQSDEGIYFASEINSIKVLSNRQFVLDYKQINRYLKNGYKSIFKTDSTFYEEIKNFPKSSYLNICRGKSLTFKKFWKLKQSVESNMTREDAIYLTKEKLIKATELRLRSDVPLAFCMSGGVDSNCLISIAKKELNYDVSAFSVINDNDKYDEKDLIYHSVKELGINHFELNLSKKNFIENLYELIKAHSSPISTISYYLHFQLIEKIAKQGFKISISGTGADELFTGYYDHFNLFFKEIFHNDILFNRELEYWKKFQMPLIRNENLKNYLIYINSPNERKHVYSEEDNDQYFVSSEKEEFSEEIFDSDILRNRMLNELFFEAVPVILHEDDLNCMYYSIENRSPFLDVSLLSHAYSIPTKFLINNGFAKSILRDSMINIVPSKILQERKKTGFNAPIEELIDFSSKEVINEILSFNEIYNLIKKDKIIELLAKKNFSNFESKFIFNFLNCAIFMETNNSVN